MSPASVPRSTPDRRPTRGVALRPWSRENRRERRLSRRLAAGLTPAQAARAESLPEADVAALLADPAFAELVEAYREIRAEPEAQARETLRRLARILLEDAVAEGDLGAACFVLREEARGRDPAVTLADGLIATARRPAAVPASPVVASTRNAPPRPPADPVDRACWRVAARLRDAVLVEHATLHGATGPAAAPPPPAVVPLAPRKKPVPSPASPRRRLRRRQAAPRRRHAPATSPTPPGGTRSRDPPRGGS